MTRIFTRRGQAMIGTTMVIGIIAVVLIGAIVYKTQVNQRANVSSNKSTAAYQLAHTAVEKGIHILNSNSGNWDAVGKGNPIPGYSGDTVYTDMPGGAYKIAISAGPGPDDRTIIGYGKDNSAKPQYRGLEVVLSKASNQFGPLMGNSINLAHRTKVHWGPVYAYDTLNVDNKSRVFYPRLFSKGKIKHIDNDPALPNTDGVRWWSFNFPPGVPQWPQIDFAYYKAQAKAQGLYYAKGDRDGSSKRRHGDDDDPGRACGDDDSKHDDGHGDSSWRDSKPTCGPGKDGSDGTCHYDAGDHRDSDHEDKCDEPDNDSYSFQNIIDTQPYVRFFDQGTKVKFKNGTNMLRGVIIALGDIEFTDGVASVKAVNARYAASGLPNFYPRTESIPQTAWLEYKKIDTAQSGDYPGDIGGPGASGVNATYNFGANTTSNVQSATTIHFEGFLYAANTLKIHRGGNFVGVVMAANKSIQMEGGSDEDSEGDDDDRYDCDHRSDDTASHANDDKDHHDQEDKHFNGDSDHVDHITCGDHDVPGHSRRLTIYYQDNLKIHVIGSGQKQTLWQEVPSPAF